MAKFWVGVVSRSHVLIGVRGGFIQLNHGRKSAVQRLKAGDRLVVYSPRTDHPDGAALQAFTAIGTVTTGEVYTVDLSPGFTPHRVDVAFEPCREAPIKPLIERLSFIKDKQHWGAAFRFGHLGIGEADFRLIESVMCPLMPTAAAA